MDLNEAKKLPLLKDGHVADLGISCLIDDEIPGGLDVVMRDHIKRCSKCRKRMAEFLRVERLSRPEK